MPTDHIVSVIMALFFAFLILFLGFFFGNFNSQAQLTLQDDNAKHALDVAFGARYSETWDSAFIMIFIGFILSLVISSYFIDNSPVFFVVSLLGFIVFMMVVGLINNVFLDVANSNALGLEIDKYPMMNFVFSNLLMFAVLIFILTSAALFAKRGTSGGEG